MERFTDPVAFDILKNQHKNSNPLSLHDYLKEDSKKRKNKILQHHKWLEHGMRTEFNKGLNAGKCMSMEDVVVATATTMSEMGVGPNECQVLQQELGDKRNNVIMMLDDLSD